VPRRAINPKMPVRGAVEVDNVLSDVKGRVRLRLSAIR